MRRFTILSLMACITVLAIGLAALRDANAVWAGLLLMATLLLLGTAVLGMVYGIGRSRAGWLGFGLFAGSYLALAIAPWLAESLGEKLPTTQALRYVHSRVESPQYVLSSLKLSGQVTLTTGAPPGSTIVLDSAPAGRFQTRFATASGGSGSATFVLGDGVDQTASVNRWKALLPGASNYEAFQQVGHCLFALLAGLTGALIARRFHAVRERGRAAGVIGAEAAA